MARKLSDNDRNKIATKIVSESAIDKSIELSQLAELSEKAKKATKIHKTLFNKKPKKGKRKKKT